MSDQITIQQARQELLWRQPFVTEESLEKALEYGQAYVAANPRKIEKWKGCPAYKPIMWYAEHYLFDQGVVECPNPKGELEKIMRQAKGAGWMPQFVMVRVAMLRRALKEKHAQANNVGFEMSGCTGELDDLIGRVDED